MAKINLKSMTAVELIDLRASVLLIPIAHSLVALPFVVRAMAPVIRSIDPRLREQG